MLPSSKLLPMTIVGLVGILSLKAYALATTTPSPALLRAGAEQALAAVGTTAASGMITQANAASVPPAIAARPGAAHGAGGDAVNPVRPAAFPRTEAAGTPAAPALHAPVVPAPALPAPALPAPAMQAPAAAEPGPAAVAPAAALPVAEASPADRAALNSAQQPFDRASELVQREATIAAAEKRLNERVGELQVLQQRLQGLDAALKERDGANWTGLVKLYEGMKPREAASILNSLEKPVLLEILDRMKAGKASPILAAMDPERARQVTAELAAKRTGSTAVPSDAPSRTTAASAATADATTTN